MPSNCGAGEDTWESLGQQEDQTSQTKSLILKGNQPWILIGRTDAKAEAPVFWSPDENSQLIGKIPVAGKVWRQKEKRELVDEMAGWHHQCNGHELEQTPGDGKAQGGLVCYSPWGWKESDMTGWLNNNTWPQLSSCTSNDSVIHYSVLFCSLYV